MRRVLVVTWALGTASGVLLGLFGVQLVSSRFSTARVSPLSHPEVLRALQAARSVPVAPESELAAPSPAPDTAAAPPPSPPIDAAPARPSAGATSTPAQASPASTLPRPGATAGSLIETAAAPTSSSSTTTTATTLAPTSSSTTTTAKPAEDKPKSGSKKSSRSSTTSSSTTTTTARKTTTTTGQSSKPTASRTQTKTLSSNGGVVTVRWFSDGTVKIDVARPNAGYEMRVSSNGPDKVVVYFWKQGRISEVRAWFQDGAPASKVTEWECSGSYPNIRCRER